jgi:hypothetical protein
VAELIATEQNGLLVPPEQAEPLADALLRLIRDPALRSRLGKAGAARVTADFDSKASLGTLAALFDSAAAEHWTPRRVGAEAFASEDEALTDPAVAVPSRAALRP